MAFFTRRESCASLVGEVAAATPDRPLPEAVADLGDAIDAAPDEIRLRVRLAACVDAAFESVRGHRLYPTQLHAGLAMMDGRVAEMATGEGKTFAAALPATYFAAAGRGTHVVTANDYLVVRDAELLRPVYAAMGLTVAPLPEQSDGNEAEKVAAYAADITYGTGHEFGFDFLRDRLAAPAPRASVRQRLAIACDQPLRMQRGLHAAVVDEIDHVLLDDALSPLVLSQITHPLAPDAEAHRLARDVALSLPTGAFVRQPSVRLLDAGTELALDALTDEIAVLLARPWLDYVRQALHAEYGLARDADYLIGPPKPPERGGDGQPEIQLVDSSTGRIFKDRTWSDGLHQAVETKEGLPIRGGTSTMARITKQRLFGRYVHLCGMTGTAAGCGREFTRVYGAAIEPVPLRCPSRRVVSSVVACSSAEQKWVAVAVEAIDRAAAGQPVLVGTASIRSSVAAADELRRLGAAVQVLNGQQDAAEAAVVAAAGRSGTITVATNLAGRGTDISLDEAARAAGGLHVIVAEATVSERVLRQLIGRAARQGDPGSASQYVAGDDAFLQQHAPWLADAITQQRDVASALVRIQRRVDRAAERHRIELWKRDTGRDDWIGRLAAVGSRSA